MRPIEIETLSAQAFVPFGSVIEADAGTRVVSINAGTCRKFAELAYPDCSADLGRPAIHIYRADPAPMPFTVKAMERHTKGSQTFFPINGRPYLVVVAPSGEFDTTKLRAFKASAAQGVQFAPGTWHHFCLALPFYGEGPSEFLVIDRVAPQTDCDEITLATDARVLLNPAP